MCAINALAAKATCFQRESRHCTHNIIFLFFKFNKLILVNLDSINLLQEVHELWLSMRYSQIVKLILIFNNLIFVGFII